MASVLDASALLAYFNDEAGAAEVEEAIAEFGLVSAVNWSEVLTKVEETGLSAESFEHQLRQQGILGQLLTIASFGESEAAAAATLRRPTRDRGLSLGDRACLALARSKSLPALTADRIWGELELEGVEIRLIR